MHDWSDKSVDFNGIDKAAEYIGLNLIKWGRVNVRQYKEKFGTVRVYCSFGWYQLFNVTHPGYHYNRYPIWLWNLDCLWLSKIFPLLNFIIVPLQEKLYTYCYRRAIKKWPHLRKEILSGADYSELLKGL